MIYGYRRCSTNEDKQNVDRQLKDTPVDRMFTEYASGKNEQGRPVFNGLKEILVEGDTVCFHDMSRAGRNTQQLLKTVEELVGKGVKIEFVTENLTFVSTEVDPMQGSLSKLLLALLSSVNEMFLTQLSIATKQGLAVAKENGSLIGGANPKQRESFQANRHNHKSRHNHQEAIEKRKPVADMIRDMIKFSRNGLNLKQMAAMLNEKGVKTPRGKDWSEVGVSKLIKSEGIEYSRSKNRQPTGV